MPRLKVAAAGAAIVREREHGTMDHLLVMPLTPFEIAISKVWSNGLVITVAVGVSLVVVIRGLLGVPIAGSIPLFLAGVVIYVFFATAIGIFLGTVARSMPQLGLLYMAVGEQYPAREHAAVPADRHAGISVNALKCSRRIRPIVSTVSIPPTARCESQRAAHQANL